MHHLATCFGESCEAIRADFMGHIETVSCRGVEEKAFQLIPWCKGNRMYYAVESIPLLAEFREGV